MEATITKPKERTFSYEEVLEGTKGKSIVEELKEGLTADKLIRFFSVIPEEGWCRGSFLDVETGQSCAMGWFIRGYFGQYNPIKWVAGQLAAHNVIGAWSHKVIHRLGPGYYQDIASVNDGHSRYYRQPTPKQRVLAFLEDAKEAGF